MQILFVCTGNTCRSNMAEAIFSSLCNKEGLKAVSAGVSVVKDSRTSKNSAIVINKYMNMDISNREAVQISAEIVTNSDLVLTMTSYQRELLCNCFPKTSKKVYTLNQYVGVEGEVLDPYGGDVDVYIETFNQLKSSIELLLKKIQKEDKSIN